MHELSIAENLVGVVLEALQREGGGRVLSIHLKVGQLSSVSPDALLFCFDIATRNTPLEGTALKIDLLPILADCPTCARPVPLEEPIRFQCPICATPIWQLIQGKELEVESIMIEGPDDAPVSTPSPPSP